MSSELVIKVSIADDHKIFRDGIKPINTPPSKFDRDGGRSFERTGAQFDTGACLVLRVLAWYSCLVFDSILLGLGSGPKLSIEMTPKTHTKAYKRDLG